MQEKKQGQEGKGQIVQNFLTSPLTTVKTYTSLDVFQAVAVFNYKMEASWQRMKSKKQRTG